MYILRNWLASSNGLINKSFFEVKDEQGGQMLGVVISASYWKPKEPFFEIDINWRFMPYLEQLVRDFTKLELDSILKLKSKYSLNIYKFLCSWTDESKKTKKQVSIFELEKENQKQEKLISQEQVNCMLNNIDKDSQVVFDN